ncbi:amino acid adenylation domain-containing protein, partial [Streptomyces sp.]|uniref:amino acid adenylation domain-containing protein n=1 Tax=Streptomyces sp. TaxID=1931 RepID=UPI002F42BC75
TPDRVAVTDPHGSITYAELLSGAEAVAARLRAAGAAPDTVVALCAERSVPLVTAMLGILLADCAYLPLDAEHPTARLAHILAESEPIAVLADPEHHAALHAAGARRVTDLTAACLPPVPPRAAGATADDTSLVYVIYTSGSTGHPKGVAVPHRGVVNRLRWGQRTYELGADDVVLQKTPYTFDVSVWEFFWPLTVGARLLLCAPGAHRDPEHLVDLVIAEGVTTMHFVPSMLEPFLREPGLARCTSLRQVFCSGEALTSALANRFTTAHPARLHNLYGPTEASIEVTAWECRRPEPGAAVPIGRPIDGVTAFVVDDTGAPCPPGQSGELLLGGICVARGYLGRPDLTAAAFAPGPDGRTAYRTGDLARWSPDGYLEYLGRADHQVKLRGLRVELGEIEAVLSAHPAVAHAVVSLRDDIGPASALAAYVVVTEPVAVAHLRTHLRARLPEYMVPSYVVPLREVPLTSSGKTDRAALPAPGREHRIATLATFLPGAVAHA